MTQPEMNSDINSDDAKCIAIISLVHLLVLHLVTSVCQEIYIYIDIRVYICISFIIREKYGSCTYITGQTEKR